MSNVLAIDGNSFSITKTDDKSGKVLDTVKVEGSIVMSPSQVGTVLAQVHRSAGTIRDGFLSFLTLVYASPRLDGFRLSGDAATGKLSKEFKAAVRDAESDVVGQLVSDKSLKLPGKDADNVRIQAFLSTLRDDKNYSNVKNTTNKFVAFCMNNIATESGHLIPVPYMQAMLAEAIDKADTDKSFSSKLRAIEEAIEGPASIDAVDCIDALAAAKRLVAKLTSVSEHYAEMATTNAALSVPDAAQAAIAKAAATPIGTRQRAPKAEGATV